MNAYEKIPSTNPRRNFPMGDIDITQTQRAYRWIDRLKGIDGDKEEQIRQEMDLSALRHKDNPTHHKAVELCDTWDHNTYNTDRTVKDGYMFGLLLHEHLFQFKFADFSQELERMKQDDSVDILRFHATTREGMHSTHENFFKVCQQLDEFGVDAMNILPGSERTLFQTGMAIPYLLAACTKLHIYTPKFTSINPDAEDLLPTFKVLTNEAQITHSTPQTLQDYLDKPQND